MYYGSQNKTLREEAKAAEKARKLQSLDVPPPVYLKSPALPNPEPYNSAVTQLMANPNPGLVAQILVKLEPLTVTDIDIQSTGTAALGIKGRLPDNGDIKSVQEQLETINGIQVVSQVKAGSASQAGKTFEITVQAPMWEPEND
jgi:hypothetical protein